MTGRPRCSPRALAWGALLALACGCPGPAEAPPTPPPSPPASPAPTSAPPEADRQARARAVLERVVRERCQDPSEPWALAHGLLVAGPGLRLADGSEAVARLVEDNLAAGPEGPAFPPRLGERPIEPHPAMFLKTLLEVGVPPERSFRGPGGPVRLEELAAQAARRYRPRQDEPRFRNEAWQLEVLASVAERGGGAARERVASLARETLEVVAENQRYLEPWLEHPERPYEKPFTREDGRPAPAAIHRYFCGGLHLLQAVQRLHGAALPPLLARQYQLVRLRLELEGRYWEEKLAEVAARFQGAERQGHEEVVLAQALKLLGHGHEALERAIALGALAPGERGPDAAWERLASTVLILDGTGVYARLDAIRARAPQVYLDLVGDSAHALHAFVLRETNRQAGR